MMRLPERAAAEGGGLRDDERAPIKGGVNYPGGGPSLLQPFQEPLVYGPSW